jgi:hypothetical protein
MMQVPQKYHHRPDFQDHPRVVNTLSPRWQYDLQENADKSLKPLRRKIVAKRLDTK